MLWLIASLFKMHFDFNMHNTKYIITYNYAKVCSSKSNTPFQAPEYKIWCHGWQGQFGWAAMFDHRGTDVVWLGINRAWYVFPTLKVGSSFESAGADPEVPKWGCTTPGHPKGGGGSMIHPMWADGEGTCCPRSWLFILYIVFYRNFQQSGSGWRVPDPLVVSASDPLVAVSFPLAVRHAKFETDSSVQKTEPRCYFTSLSHLSGTTQWRNQDISVGEAEELGKICSSPPPQPIAVRVSTNCMRLLSNSKLNNLWINFHLKKNVYPFLYLAPNHHPPPPPVPAGKLYPWKQKRIIHIQKQSKYLFSFLVLALQIWSW